MVNYNNPLVLEGEFEAFIKLGHSVCAIYIWEYLTTLYFEWRIIPQMRQLKAAPIVYTVCRLSALMGVICYLVVFNVTSDSVNCNALYKSLLTFGYLAMSCFSYLIVIRSVAIWSHHMVVKCIVWPLFLANVAVMLYAIIAGPGSEWNPLTSTCTTTRTYTNRANFTTTLIADLTNLTISLVGVIRNNLKGSGVVGRVLYLQAMTWVSMVVFVVPPVALIWLNLNDVMNLMLEPVAFVMMTIVTTRMHRGLYEVANGKGTMVVVGAQSSAMFAAKPVSQPVASNDLSRTRFSVARVDELSEVFDIRQGVEKAESDDLHSAALAV